MYIYNNHRFVTPVLYALGLLAFSFFLQSCNHKVPRSPPCPPNCPSPPPLPPPASAQQHALVIGIDKYRYAEPNVLINLKGAVNDALLLRDTLRKIGVSLPNERVLLNDDATLDAFKKAWQNLLTTAQPGDTLILTYAGHGGQHTDNYPLGERDKKDESLLFHDFNPRQPTQEYMTDDELYGLLEKASDYNIVLLIDACHSSGMVRSVAKTSGSIRFGGYWDIQPELPSPVSAIEPRLQEDDNQPLPHVTLITAVNYDKLLVSETTINGRLHGALSWYFAEALKGFADGNQNDLLERTELASFLHEKVRHQMNYWQTPKLVPSQELSVIRLSPGTVPESPFSLDNIPNIALFVENTSAPNHLKHLKHVQFASSPQAADLRVIANSKETELFNNTGDKVTTLRGGNSTDWQPVINKARLLKALAMQFDMRLKPIQMSLREGDGLHKDGDRLHIDIEPDDSRLKALTLFNLSGNGQLQLLYPLDYHQKVIDDFPYTYQAQVAQPYGADHLIAVLCEKPATGLHDLLANSQPNIPEPKAILAQLHKDDNRCQVGQYAFFSSE